jgi:hypothetical protein
MNEIESLTSQVQRFGAKVDGWNASVNWLLAITAVVGILYFLATIRQSSWSKRLQTAQADLIKAKDQKLESDLRAKDLEIRQLGKETAELNGRNLKLEAIIAPRRLSNRQSKEFASLTPFANRVVEIRSYSSDTEGLVLASQILNALNTAKLQIRDNRLTMQPAGSISFGISVDGSNGKLVNELKRILSLDGNLATTSSLSLRGRGGISMSVAFGGISGGPAPDAVITVGVKPIS